MCVAHPIDQSISHEIIVVGQLLKREASLPGQGLVQGGRRPSRRHTLPSRVKIVKEARIQERCLF